MSRNVMTITKWVPLEIDDNKTLYADCKSLKKFTEELNEKIALLLYEYSFKNISKLYHIACDESFVQNLETIVEEIEQIKEGFNRTFSKLNMEKPHELTESKMQFWKTILWRIKLKLCCLLQQCIYDFISLFIYYGEQILILTLRICTTFNFCLNLDIKFGFSKGSIVCCNTCPYLMYPIRKMSITRLLQIIAQNRAELCCHKLIDCLLDTYKYYDNHDDENGSDNSSVEIYRALTRHMSPPANISERPTSPTNTDEAENDGCFSNMEELIQHEEQNVLDLLVIALKIAPSMLGNDGVKKSKNGEIKISSKARAKVLDYYQQILWGEVGNFLEHIILWWGAIPLSTRSPNSSQHLREWINQFSPTADVPTFVVSALSCLSDALGVHVTSTSWDQHFRSALVASKSTCNPDTGRLFCEMLRDLTLLCNQCEITNEWIIGAPLSELPLVEQIPVLHRLGRLGCLFPKFQRFPQLSCHHYRRNHKRNCVFSCEDDNLIANRYDHSVHITRLWAITETKKLSNSWNVESFFLITHCDIVNCLSHLSDLRLTDHTLEIEKGRLDVHVQVCANMRAKLVSEVKANIQKLKEAPNQCVDCLASICRTISLANLQMIFPTSRSWSCSGDEPPNIASRYVEKFLEQVLTPVLAATEDHQISNMILRIMCQSWLDHIYMNKIKFSQYGALQLLTDFAHVGTWIINCAIISQDMRKAMLKNEVLRRCEGVGRLLLRSRGEHIKMNDKRKKQEDLEQSPKSENTELMPAEMYVPNQEQWLELRATRRRVFITSLCCGDL